MIPTIPKDREDRQVVRRPTTKLCLNASEAAMMMSVVIPGTSARAAEPSGRAARRASAEDSGRPAAMAAAGTIRAASLPWTLVKIVV